MALQLKALIGALACFSVLWGLGQWAAAQKPEWVLRDPLPPHFRGMDNFSLFEAQGQFALANALYYDIGPLISKAREADVLVVGNSRPFFAFREDFVREAERESGLRFFSLAGPGNNFLFCQEVILRNHLRPRFIVVNDDQFFNPKLWPWQKEPMKGSWWNAWSNIYMGYYQWLIKFYIKQVFPEFNFFKVARGKQGYTLCSPENGFLFLENMSESHFPLVEDKTESAVSLSTLEMAKGFKEKMTKQGSEVVLTFVPFGTNPSFIEEEAREMGVPYILPRLDGLETFDHKHLTLESSEKFSKAFFKELFRLPEVKELITARH